MQMHGYGMHFSSHLSAELHHVYPGLGTVNRTAQMPEVIICKTDDEDDEEE